MRSGPQLLPLLLLLAAAQAGEVPPDFVGRFILRYEPITCVRAPCPAGMITVETGMHDRGVVSAKRIEPDTRTPPELAERLKAFPARAYVLIVEGELRVVQGEGGATVVIYARSLEAPSASP